MSAGLLVTALVAVGVTLAVLQIQSPTNPQQVNLRSGVTIAEDSAVVQAAAKARPAVVSVVTQQKPTVTRGSGYLVTSDGYIVTNIEVIAGAGTMTVLVPGDDKTHDARLVDYDCQTGVAVLKIDKVRGLPTLAFADPTALARLIWQEHPGYAAEPTVTRADIQARVAEIARQHRSDVDFPRGHRARQERIAEL